MNSSRDLRNIRFVHVKHEFDDYDNVIAFITDSGQMITTFDGCDWKDDPSDIIDNLKNLLNPGDQLVAMLDGSDTKWFGIIRKDS